MYFQKKRVIAMLLAGGQGSRLKVLTEKTAQERRLRLLLQKAQELLFGNGFFSELAH